MLTFNEIVQSATFKGAVYGELVKLGLDVESDGREF